MVTLTRITFYALLLLLVSCAAGLAGDETKEKPPASVAPDDKSKAAASGDFMGKMLQYIALKKHDREIPPVLVQLIGLTASTDSGAWLDSEVTAMETATGINYGFAVSRGNDHDLEILILYQSVVSVRFFRVRRDGKLLGAVYFDTGKKELSKKPITEAQADFDTAWAFWNNSIDVLMNADAQRRAQK